MREIFLKLEDISEELKKQLELKDGKIQVDEKWLVFFDALIVDTIKTRDVLNFAVGKKVNIDWEFVLESIKKAKV